MKLQNGGYVIVTHDDANIYQKVASAYENGKPILFYDDDKKCYYIDSIAKGVNVYTLVKGGKTFEVTSSNTLSSTGSVDAPTMENIKDLNGNLRFIEDSGSNGTLEGLTITYNKWSLSGTHLMLVIAGEVANATEIPSNFVVSNYTNLPKYIVDKIIPTKVSRVEVKSFSLYADDYSGQTNTALLVKPDANSLRIILGSLTLNADRAFRVQFDLLIDAE